MFIKKGQPIVTEGNPAEGLYALYSGKVKVHQKLANGQEQIIEMLKPSDIFGYKALLCNEPYSYSATAIEDSLVCMIAKDAFDEVVERSHTLKKDIIFKLVDQINIVQKKLEMNAKSARERVLDAIVNLMFVYGTDENTGYLNVQIARKDLANFAGLTLETTVRTLSAMKSEGLIILDNKRIAVLDKQQLLAEANVL